MCDNVKEFPQKSEERGLIDTIQYESDPRILIPLYFESMNDDLDHRPNIINMLGGTIGEDCVSKDTMVHGFLVKTNNLKKGSLVTILRKDDNSTSYTPSLMEPFEDGSGIIYMSIEDIERELYAHYPKFSPALYDYEADGPKLKLESDELEIHVDVNMGTWEMFLDSEKCTYHIIDPNDPDFIIEQKIVGVGLSTTLVSESNIIEAVQSVSFNHEQGMAVPVDGTDTNININITDVTEDMVNADSRLKDSAKENLKDYNLTDEEVLQMIHVMERYRNKEDFSVFHAMPEKMQSIIRKEAVLAGASNQSQINWLAKELLETFITEMKVDKAWIELEESIKKELAIPDLMDMYSDYIRSMMEEELEQKAVKIEIEHPEKAAKLREISAAFRDTYTFARVFNMFESNARPIRRLDEGIAKYNRICDDFIYKFKDSKFIVGDISKIPFVLARRFPTYGDDMYKAFVAVLWSTFENIDINNMADMSYVYFTIKNILVLDFVGEDKTEFSKHLIENIIQVFELIKKALQEREERKNVSKKRNKRNK